MTDGATHDVRPDVAGFLAFLNAQEGPAMEDMPPAAGRAMMRAMGDLADVPRGTIASVEDRTIPGPAGDIPIRIYDSHPGRETGPVMVFYHGGGFVIGDLETHDPYCAEAARLLDMPVIAVDYRLAPEHRFPAAPNDCEAATRWIADHIPCTGLVLSGESAGGNLTIATALTLRDKPASKPVIAIHPIYPVVTMNNDWPSYYDFGEGHLLTATAMQWFMDQYRPDPADYRAAPLDHAAQGLPPTLLVTAGLDPLRDQGRAYAAKLIEAGVPTTFREAKGNIHGYICLAKAIPSAADDIADALAILKEMVDEASR